MEHIYFTGEWVRLLWYEFKPDYSNSIYRYEAPHIIHGCILEAMILAFENRSENYSSLKGNITIEKNGGDIA
jgi:hypothetical protein